MPCPRKPPVRHSVKDHDRSRSHVNSYVRGRGQASTTQELSSTKDNPGVKDEHKRKLKKIGDRITYLDGSDRVSGVVVGIRAEHYLVERHGKVYKVDRHSIFKRIGPALKGAGVKLLVAGKAGLSGASALGKAGASKVGQAIERRAEERANWQAWKKEMKREEKEIWEREKENIKREEEARKFRAKIRKGPLWKRAVKQVTRKGAEELHRQVTGKKKAKPKGKGKGKKKAKKITIVVS